MQLKNTKLLNSFKQAKTAISTGFLCMVTLATPMASGVAAANDSLCAPLIMNQTKLWGHATRKSNGWEYKLFANGWVTPQTSKAYLGQSGGRQGSVVNWMVDGYNKGVTQYKLQPVTRYLASGYKHRIVGDTAAFVFVKDSGNYDHRVVIRAHVNNKDCSIPNHYASTLFTYDLSPMQNGNSPRRVYTRQDYRPRPRAQRPGSSGAPAPRVNDPTAGRLSSRR